MTFDEVPFTRITLAPDEVLAFKVPDTFTPGMQRDYHAYLEAKLKHLFGRPVGVLLFVGDMMAVKPPPAVDG